LEKKTWSHVDGCLETHQESFVVINSMGTLKASFDLWWQNTSWTLQSTMERLCCNFDSVFSLVFSFEWIYFTGLRSYRAHVMFENGFHWLPRGQYWSDLLQAVNRSESPASLHTKRRLHLCRTNGLWFACTWSLCV